MRHARKITRVPAPAQTQGLCDNVTGDLQARFCFVLAFMTDVFVPLILPFVEAKTASNSDTDTATTGTETA